MTTAAFWKTHLWDRLGFDGLDLEEYTRRTTAVQLGLLTSGFGVIYSIIYVLLGFPGMVVTSVVYQVLFLLALGFLAVTHNFNVYKHVQLGLILLAPLVNHLIVGGFVQSSVVILSSFITPVIALTFVSRRTAWIFFYLYIVVVLVGGGWDLVTPPTSNQLPDEVVVLFFTANLIFICVIIYLLIDGFLKKQEQLRAELRQSLDTLRATQNQLIQSEKMASLGELTAGIAHEIQNPLNFVNNFAEVSVELVAELDDERQGPNLDTELEAELLSDLKLNLQKISHHGGRASSIVRGMLEHSRASTGQRELTDINALADEYLKLSYHGLRAKDKHGSTDRFNAKFEIIADASIGQVSLIPQDIGRVLLNLFNNAFYATQQRVKLGQPGYQPAVTVTTERNNGMVRIRVRDNGTGMPEEVKAKIFQPFYTTKPTGEGTGLGLSLSYDIITKGHGGTITVESWPGEAHEGVGTEFVIELPA